MTDSEPGDFYLYEYEDSTSTGTEETEAPTTASNESEASTTNADETSPKKGRDQAKPRISDMLGPYYLVKMAASEGSDKKPLWLIWNPSDGRDLADVIAHKGEDFPTTALTELN